MIKKGDEVLILPNIREEMKRLNFDEGFIETMYKKFANTKQTVYTIWRDPDMTYVSVDLSCEIPVTCCKKVDEKKF